MAADHRRGCPEATTKTITKAPAVTGKLEVQEDEGKHSASQKQDNARAEQEIQKTETPQQLTNQAEVQPSHTGDVLDENGEADMDKKEERLAPSVVTGITSWGGATSKAVR